MEIQFPFKMKFYTHSGKEDNYYQGEQIGLTDESLRTFSYTGYETEFDVEVDEDGLVYATHVNGTPLVSKVRI